MSERSTAAADGTLKKESNQTNDEGRKEGRKEGKNCKGDFVRSLARCSLWMGHIEAGQRGGERGREGREDGNGRQAGMGREAARKE